MKKKLMTLQQHRLLKEAGQLIAFSERLKHAQKETTDRNWKEREEQRRRSAKAASTVTALSGDIEEFLTSRYDFRYNLLTDETEFRPAGQRSAAFIPVGKRELNTFCIEAHAECAEKRMVVHRAVIAGNYVVGGHNSDGGLHIYRDAEMPGQTIAGTCREDTEGSR